MTTARLVSEGAAPAVKLQDLIDGLEFQPTNASSYLDRETGEIYTISEDAFRIAEDDTASFGTVPEWQEEEVMASGQSCPWDTNQLRS